MKVCIVGASGKLRQYMVKHSLDRGYAALENDELVHEAPAIGGRQMALGARARRSCTRGVRR